MEIVLVIKRFTRKVVKIVAFLKKLVKYPTG